MEDGKVLARLDARTKFMVKSQERIEDRLCTQDERIGDAEDDIIRLGLWTRLTAIGATGIAGLAGILKWAGVI